MRFWTLIQAHDSGQVAEPASLCDAVSTLVGIVSRGYPGDKSARGVSRGPVHASLSSGGGLQLWASFECENERLAPDLELVLSSLLSHSFNPGDSWARRRFLCRSDRTDVFNALKAVVPPVNANYYLDYVRPLEKIDGNRKRCIVIPLGSRLLENARQAFVPDVEIREPEEADGSDLMSLDKIAWRGLVLKPRIKTGHWDFRIRKEEDDSMFFVKDREGLGEFARATSRNALRELVRENLCFLWKTYALEADDRLTPGAQDLKRYLLSRLEEVKNG